MYLAARSAATVVGSLLAFPVFSSVRLSMLPDADKYSLPVAPQVALLPPPHGSAALRPERPDRGRLTLLLAGRLRTGGPLAAVASAAATVAAARVEADDDWSSSLPPPLPLLLVVPAPLCSVGRSALVAAACSAVRPVAGSANDTEGCVIVSFVRCDAMRWMSAQWTTVQCGSRREAQAAETKPASE